MSRLSADHANAHVPQVTVVMTVFNRLAMTIKCLDGLFSQVGVEETYHLNVVLVDDGSTDNSAAVVAKTYGRTVEILSSPGGLFWSRGMALAQRQAAKNCPDFLLWLNNDVVLQKDAIKRLLLESHGRNNKAIVVGAMKSMATGLTSYSGFAKKSDRPGHLLMMEPSEHAQLADSLNGNLVLVPRKVYEVLGTVDERFSHAYGDLDYGLRARRSGIDVVLAPRYFGHCDRNPTAGTWEDRSLPRVKRLEHLFSRKGLPMRSHIVFVSKYSRWWPILIAVTYLKRCVQILIKK